MNPGKALRNPVLQLAELFTADLHEHCNEFFYEKIDPLSGAEIRRLLTSQDDALLVILRRMQWQDNIRRAMPNIYYHSWRLLCKGIVTTERTAPWQENELASAEKRLFIRMLLRHIGLLCASAADLYNHMTGLFGRMCSRVQRGQQVPAAEVQEYRPVAAVTADVLCLFATLLLETHRDQDARAMVCMLPCLRNLYQTADAVVRLELDAVPCSAVSDSWRPLLSSVSLQHCPPRA